MLEYILHNVSIDIIHKYGIWVWYLKILYTSIANIFIVRANTDLMWNMVQLTHHKTC